MGATGFLDPASLTTDVAARSGVPDRAAIRRRRGRFACKFHRVVKERTLDAERLRLIRDMFFVFLDGSTEDARIRSRMNLVLNLVRNFGCRFPLYVDGNAYMGVQEKFGFFSALLKEVALKCADESNRHSTARYFSSILPSRWYYPDDSFSGLFPLSDPNAEMKLFFTPWDVYNSTEAAQDAFIDFRYSLKGSGFLFTTEPISLTDPDSGKVYDLGPMRVEVRIAPKGNTGPIFEVYIEPLDPSYFSGMFFHPHVSETGKPCLGDASHAVRAAISAGDVFSTCEILGRFLATYNEGDPIVPLADTVSCRVCGEDYPTDRVWECSGCRRQACDDCLGECSGCGSVLCPACMEACHTCSESYLCEDCYYRCYSCGGTTCESCYRECSVCESVVCSDCALLCSECESVVFCTEKCAAKYTCQDCGRIVCKNCEPPVQCSGCVDSFCARCLSSCDSCGSSQFCDDCLQSCEFCADTVCEQCQHSKSTDDVTVCLSCGNTPNKDA